VRSGKYSLESGASACTECASGTYSAATGASTPPSTPPVAESIPNTNDMVNYRDNLGIIYSMIITGATSGSVWGTGDFTDDSNIPTAAVHAGVVQNGETKMVYIEMRPGRQSYTGSTRNSITSNSFASFEGSYRFLNTNDMVNYRDNLDIIYSMIITGATSGSVWGTGDFTDDSNIPTERESSSTCWSGRKWRDQNGLH